jgi:hypothetical protein
MINKNALAYSKMKISEIRFPFCKKDDSKETLGRHNTQHNNIWPNDSQRVSKKSDTRNSSKRCFYIECCYAFSIRIWNAYTQHNNALHYAVCRYAECPFSFAV